MTTEARKAYEHNMPRWEAKLRKDIESNKRMLLLWKRKLRLLCNGVPNGNNYGAGEYSFEEQLCFVRVAIKSQKHIIQILKNGLPQRRPKGVIAKCPFCGAKHYEITTFDPTLPVLYAKKKKRRGMVVVGCRRCGAKIAWPTHLWGEYIAGVQDVIDVWNRRA